jgi:hypothetical protein
MLKNLTTGLGTLLGDAFKRITGIGDPSTSARDAARSVDDMAIKRKLGRSFFTRRLSPGTRWRRIGSLSRDEAARARELGWIR